MTISRVYDFAAGTKIRSAEVDAEFNNLVTAINNSDTSVTTHKTLAVLDHPDGSVTASKLASDAVTTVKVVDGAITASKLDPALITADVSLNAHKTLATLDHPDGSVNVSKLAADSVTTVKIQNGAVTSAKIDSSVATSSSVNDLAVKLRMGVYS